MGNSTKQRLGRALRLAKPLTPAEQNAAARWFHDAPFGRLLEMRLRHGGGRFCVVQGGKPRAAATCGAGLTPDPHGPMAA